MKISLIGMSGSGKSTWAKKLEEKGFKHFSVDSLLEKKLEHGLKHLGYSGLNDLAKWMRQPYEDRYATTSRTYLDYEKKSMIEIITFLEENPDAKNIVIDTTGSVIYLDKEILKKLSTLTTVVYLETPASVQQDMYQLYIKEPKPVIWGSSFNKKSQETNIEALKRCYPELLAFRTKEYEKIADVTLDYFKRREPTFTINHFLQKITI